MAIITDSDLATFMGQPALVGTPRAIMAASLASAIVFDAMGQPENLLAANTYVDRVFDGPAKGSVVFLLPGLPITAVTKVEVLQPDEVTWTLLTPDVDYKWNAGAYISRNRRADATGWGSWWPTRIKSIRVSYTAGTGVMPETVRAVALGLAARAHSNPTGVLAETIVGYQVQFGAAHSSFLALDPAELWILGLYSEWPCA